jgi:HK97 family phage major capsid protein
MAITAARTLSDFSGFLTREQSDWIFEAAYKNSLVQRLARRVPLGIAGQSIPVVTGKPTAGWVAEGAQKPATQGTVTLKTMDPKKLAAIAVVSAEVVRANPGGYMSLLREQVAEAFALAFDSAAMHGTSSPFSTNLDTGSSTQEFTGTTPAFTAVWDDLNAGVSTLVNAGKRVTGFALDVRMEPVLNAVKDSAGRPLFIESPLTETAGPVRVGRLFGREAVMGEGIYTSGPKIYAYAGDWSQVAWGAVGEISYRVSTEAAVTINGALVSLFENNLVAILAEAEYGFLVNDAAAFVKYTNAT